MHPHIHMVAKICLTEHLLHFQQQKVISMMQFEKKKIGTANCLFSIHFYPKTSDFLALSDMNSRYSKKKRAKYSPEIAALGHHNHRWCLVLPSAFGYVVLSK